MSFNLLKMLGLQGAAQLLLDHQKPAMIALVVSEINHVPDSLPLDAAKAQIATAVLNSLMKCRTNNATFNMLLPGLAIGVQLGLNALPTQLSVAGYKARSIGWVSAQIISARF